MAGGCSGAKPCCSTAQVVVRVRPMFDVEEARGEQYSVQIHPEDPRQLQARRHLAPAPSSFPSYHPPHRFPRIIPTKNNVHLCGY